MPSPRGFPSSPGSWSVQFSSVAQSCPTLCDPMRCSAPGLPVHHQLPGSTKPMSIESVMPSNHLILLLLPSIFPSIRVFSGESALCTRWPKYWSFSFNIRPSNEHPGLICICDSQGRGQRTQHQQICLVRTEKPKWNFCVICVRLSYKK